MTAPTAPRFRRLKMVAAVALAVLSAPFVLIWLFARAGEGGR